MTDPQQIQFTNPLGLGAIGSQNNQTRSFDAFLTRREDMAKKALYNSIVNRGLASGVGSNGYDETALDPSFSNIINNIDNEKLKYSQKRGKGCTDCSAFTQRVFKEATGKDIGPNTMTQKHWGSAITPGLQRAGDLVFFDTNDGRNLDVSHVGIANGDGTFTHFSSDNGGGVKRTNFKDYPFKVKKVRRG